jgi:hypothetical protein
MYFINFYIYVTVLYLSFIASLNVYSNKGQALYLRIFPAFLFLTLMVEVTSHILVQKGVDNSFLYHLFFPIEFTFYLYVAYNILSSKRIKRAIVISTIAYLIAIFIYYSNATVEKFPTLAYCGGASLVVVFYAFYYFEIINLPIHLTPKREEGFWIFVGVLLYYSSTLPIWLCTRFMENFSQGTLDYFSTLLMLMNYVLYISFIIAFLCKGIFKKKDESLYDFSEFSEFIPKDQQSFFKKYF